MALRIYVSQDHPIRDGIICVLGATLSPIIGMYISAVIADLFENKISSFVFLCSVIPVTFGVICLWGKLFDILHPSNQKYEKKQIMKIMTRIAQNIPKISNEEFFKDIYSVAFKKSHIKTRIRTAALLEISLDTEGYEERDDIARIVNLDYIPISRYMGEIDDIKELYKNSNLLANDILTAKKWYKYYLNPTFSANKSTKFCLLWNYFGDIVGIVAFWNKDIDNIETEFLPLLCVADRIAQVPIDPYETIFHFGSTLEKDFPSDIHPYRYQEINGSSFELEEYVNYEWVKTGYLDKNMEIVLDKNTMTSMTMLMLFELRYIKKIRDMINEADQK